MPAKPQRVYLEFLRNEATKRRRTVTEIAMSADIPERTLRRWWAEEGLIDEVPVSNSTIHQPPSRPRATGYILTLKRATELRRQYVADLSLTVADLAKTVGVAPGSIYNAWSKYGLCQSMPRRGRVYRHWRPADIRWIHQQRQQQPPVTFREIGAHYGVTAHAARSIYYNHREMIQ